MNQTDDTQTTLAQTVVFRLEQHTARPSTVGFHRSIPIVATGEGQTFALAGMGQPGPKKCHDFPSVRLIHVVFCFIALVCTQV